jgi:hypothetical protein
VKFVIFLLLLFTCTNISVFAFDYYFDFSSDVTLISSEKEFNVNFLYTLDGPDEKDFQLFPFLKSGSGELGSVQIFDTEKDGWAGPSQLRSNFPRLSKTALIIISGQTLQSAELCFDIQYIKTGKIYKTPCRKFWNREYFLDYFTRLNQRLRWIK